MVLNLNNIITLTDFISEKPQILLNKSTRSRTVYGGLLSLVSVVLISIVTVKMGLDMINRVNSTLTYNQIPVTSGSFNYSKFPFMVALLDNGLKLIAEEERYYSFLADVWNFYPDNSTGTTIMNLKRVTIETERCNIDKHFGEYRQYFKEVPYLEHHFCMKPGQNITLYGIYGSVEPYNFLDFWISTCVNNTAENRTNCYPREVSKARLVNTYLSYQYLEYFLDHSNIECPGQLILRSETFPVSSTIYKRDFVYMREINYFTDFDFLFSSNVQQNYHRNSQFRETADLRPEGTVPGSFALVSVLLDSYFDQYYRRFTKFQEVLANIGGLFKGVIFIAYVINYFFFDEIYYFNLVSAIFSKQPHNYDEAIKLSSYEGIDTSQIKISDSSKMKVGKSFTAVNQIKFGKLQLPQTQNNFDSQNLQIVFKRPDLNKLKTMKNKLELKLNNWQLLCNKFVSNKNKYKEYGLVKDILLNSLCVTNILKKISDIGKLKCFVLTPEQIRIFNSIPNPLLENFRHNTQDIWDDIILHKYSDKKMNASSVNMIHTIQAKQNPNEIDMNILNILRILNL